MPVDFLVVQAFDQYVDERHEILGSGGSDFLLVNLFRAPLGAPMSPDAIGELCESLGKRAELSRAAGRGVRAGDRYARLRARRLAAAGRTATAATSSTTAGVNRPN
ncbi:hypothetical protein LN042_35640 [Kitasatospora sp. RB6PN24]|uniref:hypothetical protein n=1 Tax=Kitasatospora humi TaxID=2893891 RepID=UPI001E2CE830|nr:hypothetical protein [Kitasatospora humi]MCC9312331.1 hypothetical protein [Kitasatospora humi]